MTVMEGDDGKKKLETTYVGSFEGEVEALASCSAAQLPLRPSEHEDCFHKHLLNW
jgi:hypothetical protein